MTQQNIPELSRDMRKYTAGMQYMAGGFRTRTQLFKFTFPSCISSFFP